MKIRSWNSMRRVLKIASCLLLISGFCAVTPIIYADEIKNFVEQWQIENKWVGDFDGMVERRIIRVLVVYNKMGFFFDKGRTRGATYDLFMEFEKYINRKQKTGVRKIKLVFLPVPRDYLIPWLIEGRGDIAAANLTITDERKKNVDFSDPLLKNVKEILITGPEAPSIENLDSLSGKEIHSRHSSSYYEHLKQLNRSFKEQGKPSIKIVAASEYMEDSDLLEMVNSGLIPMIVVDNHKARFWGEIFDNIKIYPDIFVNSGGQIAWAFRKNSPEIKKVVNEFVKDHKKGTLMGNIVLKRYLKENKWARNSLSPGELEKFQNVVEIFKKYSEKYNFDYLMVGALAYQESQLDQSKRSHVGAVGIMQILPSTAEDKNINIIGIEKLEENIHAGVKYLRFMRDRYFNDPAIDPLNQNLFAFASYNAGPAKIASLRKEARQMGLNPNVWFRNVEVVAAKRIGRETVQYVSNIYKYFLAYKLVRIKMEIKQREMSLKQSRNHHSAVRRSTPLLSH
jgi:membrane-bound lytic murein transglycosylase MltF